MINPLGPVPTPLDSSADFNTKAFALLGQLPSFVNEANSTADNIQITSDILAAVLLGMAFPEYTGTSTGTATVGLGAKVFPTQTGKLWQAGQIVVVSSGGNIMRGPVLGYSGGSLTVDVTSTVGSGSYSSWTIGLTFDGLLLAKSGANTDITSLSGLTSPIPRANTISKIESLPNPTLSANAMTLPASTHALDFRNATLSDGLPTTINGTAAAMTIPAGASLGTVSGQQSTLIEVICNSGGTLHKAIVNLAGGNDLSESGVINTTAISAGANAANVFYSNTPLTNVPYRLARIIASTQATAGQWITPPSLIQGAGGAALAAMASAGYGQSWQNMTGLGGRASGVTMYNTRSKPIAVSVTALVAGGGGSFTGNVNGEQIALCQNNGGSPQFMTVCLPIVGPGRSYSAINSSGTITTWNEAF